MKILYLSSSALENSVNAVYIKGLKKIGVDVSAFHIPKNNLSMAKKELANHKDADYIIIGYDSPVLVIYLRIFTGKPIIYNALCSVYERLIISRELASKFSFKSFYYLFLDFWAVHCSHLVMLESEAQIKYFKNLFGGSDKKYLRAWTGVDDEAFYYDPHISKKEQFTVVFRGRFLPEAGAEYVVQAAKLVESKPIKILMLGNGEYLPKIQKLISELHPNNLELITDFLSKDKLRELMQSCHLTLGQLSSHPRLERTIPHKAFESLAMNLPYLTASNKAISELLTDEITCLTCEPANPESIAEKIIWAYEHQQELKSISERGYELYLKELTPVHLAEKLLTKTG